MKSYNVLVIALILFTALGCRNNKQSDNDKEKLIVRAQETLDSLYKYYGTKESNLLWEMYPFNEEHKVTYLASEQKNVSNQYAFLWPYSGTFSAVNAIIEATNDSKYKQILDNRVLAGLEEYFDTTRQPAAYASYINSAPPSDRFYDDNVWLGIDFSDIYMQTKEDKYLHKAKLIWEFILSGKDDKLGGGIYWCEQNKGSKHSCSNAPAAVYAFKLFEATADSTYFEQGKSIYEWTYKNLRDSTDNLYYDNINLEGGIDKAKYAYNSGQMLQAAALLYKLTKEDQYLKTARDIAESCYSYFFNDFETPEGDKFRMLKKRDIWFTAVMFRGFIELYKIDNNTIYIDTFRKNLDYAWNHMRDENGLFNSDWSGEVKDESKWVLTQAAMAEMYARLALLNA
ncbi:glycoside hydrolase family 76 protein [Dysgonomonas sp. 511]|uniref:glycoside hydrolase family 76 protein n=1 Tax=Dysgonomonas sp. 511 TaxID=2302930 RepID=UPI0013D46E01|nr:glycoside hydrolase family 76 protein [Dysgonomonas sp. 511]NDV77995.1 alpha-1,6-mannanase [Dysgonomonas sp. 511]